MATENEDTNELAYSSERLGLTPVARIALASGLSYVTGFVLGNAHGGRNAALRFRAENSHRLPTRQADWYRYHKAKHAYVLLASIKEGNRMGLRLVPWVALFYGIEEAVDNKFQRDFMSTTVAALAVSGSFSLWSAYFAPPVIATSADYLQTRCRFPPPLALPKSGLSEALVTDSPKMRSAQCVEAHRGILSGSACLATRTTTRNDHCPLTRATRTHEKR